MKIISVSHEKTHKKLHTLVYIQQMIQSREKNDVRNYVIQKSFSFIKKYEWNYDKNDENHFNFIRKKEKQTNDIP